MENHLFAVRSYEHAAAEGDFHNNQRMSLNPKVLMLDEPTSSLAANEVENLFKAIRELKKRDIIIIYISHKLQEIPQITDTITVLRDGKFVGSVNICDISNQGIINMMFGETQIRQRPNTLKVQNHVWIMGRADQGPFSLLSLLRGTQEFMMDLLDEEPEVIKHALE